MDDGQKASYGKGHLLQVNTENTIGKKKGEEDDDKSGKKRTNLKWRGKRETRERGGNTSKNSGQGSTNGCLEPAKETESIKMVAFYLRDEHRRECEDFTSECFLLSAKTGGTFVSNNTR